MGADIAPTADPHINPGSFEIMPVNWDSIKAFIACETQWAALATLTGAIWLGLDYQAVDVVLRRLGLPDRVFEDLQVMEGAALEVFGEVQS